MESKIGMNVGEIILFFLVRFKNVFKKIIYSFIY